MPHIDIKLFPGRSDEMKKAAAEKIIEAAAAELGAPTSAFSVAFTEIEKGDHYEENIRPAAVASSVSEPLFMRGKEGTER